MPSTRSRLRNSQSQSSSLESKRAGAPAKHAEDETFESLSMAVLPLAYTIKLAHISGSTPSDAQEGQEYTRGQEYLSDGIRRVGDREGNLGDLVRSRSRKRRRVEHGGDHSEGSVSLDKDILWYTAGLRHACSCDLEPLPHSFTPRRPPPASEDLSTIPDHSDFTGIVRLGEDIPPWHQQADGYIDLEPGLDDLQDFELGWRNSLGTFWAESHGSGRFCEALDSENEEVEEEVPNRSMVQETPVNRWLRKGKFKAFDHLTPTTVPGFAPDTPMHVHQVVLETPYPPTRVPEKDVLVNDSVSQERIDWEQEAKRRKQLWRGLIGKDPGYGQFWDTLPRPHSYANIGALRNLPKPPDYNLFRKYHVVSHPFHPELQLYARLNPCGRVYWLIPIHGPVVVPHLNDDVLTSPIATKETTIPLPSSAVYSTKVSDIKTRLGRPATVHWNASLLDHFIQSFLLPLRRSRVYGISIVFSGPKPDPFIALIPPAKLLKHAHADSQSSKPNGVPEQDVMLDKSQNGSDPSQPVRVEAGDQMRVYCDAKDALSLRTWLHGVHVDAKATGQAGDAGHGGKGRRLFDKVRLCLIGEKGEVLIVA